MIIKLLSTLRRYALLLIVLYIILITYLSLINLSALPEIGLDVNDKLIHTGAYLVFIFLTFNFLQKIEQKRAVVKAIFFTAIYGIIIEILQQMLSANRTFDLYDIIANFIGIIMGYFVIHVLNKMKLN